MAKGIVVSVEGDLPDEILDQIGAAVRETVRQEVAKIDALSGLEEQDQGSAPQGLAPGGDVYTRGFVGRLQ